MGATLIGFIGYLVLVMVAGAITYRMTKTQEDFLLAGRKLNVWVATFSERASGESAWLLLGLPAAAATVGLVETWTALGCVTGIALAWWFVAEGLRRETEALDALTLPQYFARRFGAHANAIRFVATLIIIFFYSFYLAAQFNGAGTVLRQTFDIPTFWGIVIGAVIIVLYTMMGGFIAVAWTDVVQAIIMIGTLVILPVVGLWELSQRDPATLHAVGSSASSWTGGLTGFAAVGAVVSGLSWGFGYAGQPHTITRFMSIHHPETIRVGRRVAIAWAVPAFGGAMLIGLIGARLYDVGSLTDTEQLMPMMALDLLPGWLAGVFISGAVAAMMSTADSQLLVGTSAFSEDLCRRSFGWELSPRQLVALSRMVTLLLGLGGFLLAITSGELIFTLVSYAWSGLGSSFGPAVIFTLHWKRTTGPGVLAGMLTGAGTTVLWSNLPINDVLHARLVSFVLACVALVIVSRWTPPTPSEAAAGR